MIQSEISVLAVCYNAVFVIGMLPFRHCLCPRRSHPAKHGVDRFGPPTLERSGSEHRVGRFPPSLLRFLSPANGGTEGGVKTIEERLGEKGGAFFNGKEGRDDFRTSYF